MAPVAHAGRVDARTVLLADDDEDVRVALAEALDEEGYAVVAVANGAAALAALEHAAKGRAPAPDLLVLDLLMPGMGGLAVLQKLRKSARTPRRWSPPFASSSPGRALRRRSVTRLLMVE